MSDDKTLEQIRQAIADEDYDTVNYPYEAAQDLLKECDKFIADIAFMQKEHEQALAAARQQATDAVDAQAVLVEALTEARMTFHWRLHTGDRDIFGAELVASLEACNNSVCRSWRNSIPEAVRAAQERRTAERAALESPELLEQLAAIEHERWSSWERYRNRPEKTAEDEQRWIRQRETPYAELSDREKESDRVEARKGIAVIKKALAGEEG